MAGGAYIALSGLRSRAEHLERLASDIANAGTSGYKAERGTTSAAERPTFDRMLESAIDVAPGPSQLDFQSGVLVPTGRDPRRRTPRQWVFRDRHPGRTSLHAKRCVRAAGRRHADHVRRLGRCRRERTDQAGARNHRHRTGRHGQGRIRGGGQAEDRGFLRLLAAVTRGCRRASARMTRRPWRPRTRWSKVRRSRNRMSRWSIGLRS